MPSLDAACKTITRTCLLTQVRTLNRATTSIYDHHLRSLALGPSQLTILVTLRLLQTASPRELEQELRVEKSTLSRNLHRMYLRGWIDELKTTDRRSHRLQLTRKGTAVLRGAYSSWQHAQSELLSWLRKDDVKALGRMTQAILTLSRPEVSEHGPFVCLSPYLRSAARKRARLAKSKRGR